MTGVTRFVLARLVLLVVGLARRERADLLHPPAAAGRRRPGHRRHAGHARSRSPRSVNSWDSTGPSSLQYLDWIGGLLRGDLGSSLVTGTPVASELAQKAAGHPPARASGARHRPRCSACRSASCRRSAAPRPAGRVICVGVAGARRRPRRLGRHAADRRLRRRARLLPAQGFPRDGLGRSRRGAPRAPPAGPHDRRRRGRGPAALHPFGRRSRRSARTTSGRRRRRG